VEFKPGAHLNVIVAPNGTGKSTLVNGICLGLAGKTKWLGRASQPTEFIKHGQSKATTEIELYVLLALL
jgi:chromosome segregation ATPase